MVPHLKVAIGTTVAEGSLLAIRKQSWLGLSKIEIKSPVVGIVAQIDDVGGMILIDPLPSSTTEPTLSLPAETATKPAKPEVQPESETAPDPEPPATPALQEATTPNPDSPSPAYVRPSHQQSRQLSGTIGFGTGTGIAHFISTEINPDDLSSDYKHRILLVTQIPSLMAMFKASAIGIEGIIAASAETAQAEALVQAMKGKAQLGFLLVDANTDLKPLTEKTITLTGQNTALW